MNERIKELRKSLGLTQQEFAEQIGSVQNTITGYETGRRIPSNQVISLICMKFNVNQSWLRDGEGEMFVKLSKAQEIADFMTPLLSDESDGFKRRFITMLSRLDESDWLVLAKMAEEMTKG